MLRQQLLPDAVQLHRVAGQLLQARQQQRVACNSAANRHRHPSTNQQRQCRVQQTGCCITAG
jgi:hypothetical protein